MTCFVLAGGGEDGGMISILLPIIESLFFGFFGFFT
jgi:hypothetical protein